MTERIQNYRGALSLNNAGVQLLMRGHLREAFAVFQDAISVMKATFRTPCKGTSVVESIGGNSGVEAKLQVAAKLLSKYSSSPHKDSSIDIRVVDFNHSSLHLQSEAESISPLCFYAVRMEQAAGFDSINREPDLESSCVLHNFAIASFLLAKTSPRLASKLEANATTLLNLSAAVASCRLGECEDDMEYFSLFTLLHQIFYTMSLILTLQGDHEGAAAASKQFGVLQDAFAKCHYTELHGYVSISSAAAA